MELTDALRKEFVRAIVRGGWYDFARARREGISPGFLGAVLEDDLGKVVGYVLCLARESGEFFCPRCELGYRMEEASLDPTGDVLECPKCGFELQADYCAVCGAPLEPDGDSRGVWVCGFVVCPGCERRARQLLGRPRG